MRENWARRVALLTGLLVLLLAIVFALIQKPVEPPVTTANGKQIPAFKQLESIGLDQKCIDAGQQIYKQQACARCHSIAGQGNPRNLLDGVGARRTALALRDWITGADVLHGELSTYTPGVNQAYRKLSSDDLDAMIIYMQSLSS